MKMSHNRGINDAVIAAGMAHLLSSVIACALVIWYVARSGSVEPQAAVTGFIAFVIVEVAAHVMGALVAIKKIHRPLAAFTDAIEQAADGNLDAAIEHQADDEVGRLVAAFDKLRATMSGSFEALRDYVRDMRDRIDELKFLTYVDGIILGGERVDVVLDVIAHRVSTLMDADLCSIAVLDKDQRMKVKGLYGFTEDESHDFLNTFRAKGFSPESCPSLLTDKVVAIDQPHLALLNDELKVACERLDAKTVVAAPLMVEGQPLGYVVLWFRNGREFDEWRIDRFKLFVDQLAVLIRSANLVEGMQTLTIEIMRALANAIDARDRYTGHHSDRVSQLSVALAQELGLPNEDIQTIEYAGLLHDIGKIGIDERILNKPDKLTEDEMRIMKNHTVMSAKIIEPIEFLKDIIPIISHHHEWMNGGGYPNGISGDEIPLGARILAVADALEAMTSDRPYRKRMPLLEGAHRLQAGAGTQFDPEVVKAMLRVVERIEAVEIFDRESDAINDAQHVDVEAAS